MAPSTVSIIHIQERIMAGKDKQQGGGENFADNPDKASESGRKGGQEQQKGSGGGSRQSQQDNDSEAGGQQRGGSGNFANDPERASEAGRKGGEHSHDRKQVRVKRWRTWRSFVAQG
jgi:general stress protein YciG